MFKSASCLRRSSSWFFNSFQWNDNDEPLEESRFPKDGLDCEFYDLKEVLLR